MPEYRDLNAMYPAVDWNARARGLGATVAIPLTSAGEENLLQLAGDRYVGENILVHEFAHSILNLGILAIDPGFGSRLDRAYKDAMDAGL